MLRDVQAADLVLLTDAKPDDRVDDLQDDERGDDAQHPGGNHGRNLALERAATFEQTDRLAGVPIEIEVRMEQASILIRTLTLFGITVVLAALTFGVVIWWTVRKGRKAGGQ